MKKKRKDFFDFKEFIFQNLESVILDAHTRQKEWVTRKVGSRDADASKNIQKPSINKICEKKHDFSNSC